MCSGCTRWKYCLRKQRDPRPPWHNSVLMLRCVTDGRPDVTCCLLFGHSRCPMRNMINGLAYSHAIVSQPPPHLHERTRPMWSYALTGFPPTFLLWEYVHSRKNVGRSPSAVRLVVIDLSHRDGKLSAWIHNLIEFWFILCVCVLT